MRAKPGRLTPSSSPRTSRSCSPGIRGSRGAGYLSQLERERCGLRLAEGRVPASFLIAEVQNEMVGRISIRHQLNAWLTDFGGHIGYCVRPAFRRRGHATAILSQGLIVARTLGITAVLLTVDEDNAGSINVIERLGGHLEDTRLDSDGITKLRYWIC